MMKSKLEPSNIPLPSLLLSGIEKCSVKLKKKRKDIILFIPPMSPKQTMLHLFCSHDPLSDSLEVNVNLSFATKRRVEVCYW